MPRIHPYCLYYLTNYGREVGVPVDDKTYECGGVHPKVAKSLGYEAITCGYQATTECGKVVHSEGRCPIQHALWRLVAFEPSIPMPALNLDN